MNDESGRLEEKAVWMNAFRYENEEHTEHFFENRYLRNQKSKIITLAENLNSRRIKINYFFC